MSLITAHLALFAFVASLHQGSHEACDEALE
jgi:hypothetical protein